MKKLLSIILVMSIITSALAVSIINVGAENVKNGFTDTKASDWFYDDVIYVNDKGIMKGTSESTFSPSASLSRAMSVTILYRMAGEPDTDGITVPFTDVADGKWYSDAVAWAYGCGVSKGKTSTDFAPNDDITRAEFTVLLSRFAYVMELELHAIRDGSLADSMLTPKYAKTAEQLLYQSGVINGKSGNKFAYHATITRAEAAAMIHRFDEKAVPLDPDAYTDVVFIGNSITFAGNTRAHFEALGEDMNLKVHDYSEGGAYLADHYEWFAYESMSPYTNTVEEAEIVILQDYGGGIPTMGEDEELAALRGQLNHPGLLFGSGDHVVSNLMELLGTDKDYYSFTANLPSGPMKYDTFVDWNGRLRMNDNETILKIKDILSERYGIEHIYVSNLALSEPALGLTCDDLYPDQVHPTDLMGYIIALTTYCKIFKVDPTVQNNGNLSYDSIPGATIEEKDRLIAEIKLLVKESLELQK